MNLTLKSRKLFAFIANVCPKLSDLRITHRKLDLGIDGGLCLLSELRNLQKLWVESIQGYLLWDEDLDWLRSDSGRVPWSLLSGKQKLEWNVKMRELRNSKVVKQDEIRMEKVKSMFSERTRGTSEQGEDDELVYRIQKASSLGNVFDVLDSLQIARNLGLSAEGIREDLADRIKNHVARHGTSDPELRELVREDSPRAGRRSAEISSARLASLSSANEDEDTSDSAAHTRATRSSPRKKAVTNSRGSTATRSESDSESAEDPLSEHQVRHFMENMQADLHEAADLAHNLEHRLQEKYQSGKETLRRASKDLTSTVTHAIDEVVGAAGEGWRSCLGFFTNWPDFLLPFFSYYGTLFVLPTLLSQLFNVDRARKIRHDADEHHHHQSTMTGLLSRSTTSGLSYFVFKFALTYLLSQYALHHPVVSTSRLAELAKEAAETVASHTGFGGSHHPHYSMWSGCKYVEEVFHFVPASLSLATSGAGTVLALAETVVSRRR
ncbi:hypothetical protein BGZ58_009084 [Dissophora ornata]|nr:hypothetical protein BGZ58_009084 [Dissophora ornata]